MKRYTEKEDNEVVRLTIIAFACIMFFIGVIITIGLMVPQTTETVEPVVEEGVAKAMMIKELTGLEFPPEVAKWANINFSGTTVSVETHKIDIWDLKGKQK